MLILGIEAAAKVAGAAVYEDGRILASSSANSGLTHSQTLLPMIDRVLKGSGRKLDQVDYIALTNGPGSFTGLRIGAATAKGLGLGAGIR
ncbi:MAG TPA: tRNA (adenosine(37)-N6)-threonylcarbamoyltransferase complex dimerization subunit type 1 TsaB, partial [Lachnospiraceae bacterium]|nr:tRNA (adenosine(37)-N6)-threonylcarbamoyltransferase complex dimerization subunit type 1 TsaB [Lachnospiraceae bacterium]